jgi:CRP-like cAMP-binding protein
VTERLGPDTLRELFLFEKLTDEQLAWLAERGEVRSYPAGVTVYAAGEPATTLFVLLEGTLSMTVRAGGAEVETLRTDYRGAYAGAFFAYLDDPSARSYTASVRAVTGCRFWELPAADFGWAMREWFPMATHMLSGFAIQGQATQEMVSTRERLVALGTVTAGLTHELNNPATAAARATANLHERLAGLWDELAALTHGELAAGQLAAVVDLVREAIGRRAELARLSRCRRPTVRTRWAAGWKGMASPVAGTSRRRWSPPAWTPTGSSRSPPASPPSCSRMPWGSSRTAAKPRA